MLETVSAHVIDSGNNPPQYPRTSQDVFQWKPKPKSKKPKSQIDDTRTEISYSASTALGDGDMDASTYASKDCEQTPSSRSVESKRSKKRSKKSPKDLSGSLYSDAVSANQESPDTSKDLSLGISYLVNLECPLCNDDDCILNRAAKCPLLRHNDTHPTGCGFCEQNCACVNDKGKFVPVSGLVPRDENGVAVTLLKANGGPIENSYEWAHRQRWHVPSYVRWEQKINEWATSPTYENAKADDGGQRKKMHKSRNRRKTRNTASAATVIPENVSNEEPKVEEEEQQPPQPETLRLYAEGQGFKIFIKGGEKVLINYDRKNCKYIGCSCIPKMDGVKCGCSAGPMEKVKGKRDKRCSTKIRISLVKETAHGLEPLDKKESERPCDKTENKPNEAVTEKTAIVCKVADVSAEKLEKGEVCKQESSGKCSKREDLGKRRETTLTAQDIRNQSRAKFLETSLKELLGDDYKNGNAAVESSQNRQPSDEQNFVSVLCPEQPEGAQNLGPCICGQGCSKTE